LEKCSTYHRVRLRIFQKADHQDLAVSRSAEVLTVDMFLKKASTLAPCPFAEMLDPPVGLHVRGTGIFMQSLEYHRGSD